MRVFYYLIVLMISISCVPANAESECIEIWPDLFASSYNVGYKLFHEYDSNRQFKLTEESDSIRRPIQISVWYPAAINGKTEKMKYKDYVVSTISETDFSIQDEDARLEAIKDFKNLALGFQGIETQIDIMLESETLAIKNAQPVKGKFPLIIYAPGFGGQALNNRMLCEYLASHGFIVAASASVGPESRAMTHEKSGIEAQISDMEFIIKFLKQNPVTNYSKIGVIGHSWGGMATFLLTLKESGIDAVIGLDGFHFSPTAIDLLKQFQQYKTDNLSVPFMYMKSDIPADSGFEPHDTSFLDNAVGPAYVFKIEGIRHGDYLSMFANLTLKAQIDFGDGNKMEKEHISAGFRNISKTVMTFFKAYLLDDKESQKYLGQYNSPEDIKDGDLVLEMRKLPD